MNIFPEDIDHKSIDEIRTYQEEQLKVLLQYVNKNSKFYSAINSSLQDSIDSNKVVLLDQKGQIVRQEDQSMESIIH